MFKTLIVGTLACLCGLAEAKSEDQGPATAPAVIDPSRELVFSVEKLDCHLISGIGCGHLLAPLLWELQQIPGVEHAYSNWTGTMLRTSVAPSSQPAALAERLRRFFIDKQLNPTQLSDNELTRALRDEQWLGSDRIAELSNHEFHTYGSQVIDALVREEGLDAETARKLHAVFEEVWQKSADALGSPPPQQEAYAAYWNARRQKLVELFFPRARELLTPPQLEKLMQACGAKVVVDR